MHVMKFSFLLILTSESFHKAIGGSNKERARIESRSQAQNVSHDYRKTICVSGASRLTTKRAPVNIDGSLLNEMGPGLL